MRAHATQIPNFAHVHDKNTHTIPSKVGEQLGTLNDLFEGKGYYCMTTIPRPFLS